MESIISAVITGGLALIGIIVTNILSNKAIEHKLEINQAITDTKLDNLTNEVKSHNSGVQQIPVILEKLNSFDRRLLALEDDGK